MFKSIFLVLALISAAFAQVSAPTNTPVPTVAPACPILSAIDFYDGNSGMILRTCESASGVQGTVIGGLLGGGYMDDFTRLPDGSTMLLLDDGRIVRNNLGTTEWFYAARATTFLRATRDQVVTLQDQPGSYPQQTDLYYGGAISARPLFNEPVFPSRCSQIVNNPSIVASYCINRDNGTIYRAHGSAFSPARPEYSSLYFKMEGVVFARSYNDGLLVLVTAQYDCPNTLPEPTQCMMLVACKETAPARLLFISGDNATIKVVTNGLSVGYSSSFSIVADNAYVIESQYAKNGDWLGDGVSRIDIKTGRKSTYLSVEDFQKRFGITDPDLWVN